MFPLCRPAIPSHHPRTNSSVKNWCEHVWRGLGGRRHALCKAWFPWSRIPATIWPTVGPPALNAEARFGLVGRRLTSDLRGSGAISVRSSRICLRSGELGGRRQAAAAVALALAGLVVSVLLSSNDQQSARDQTTFTVSQAAAPGKVLYLHDYTGAQAAAPAFGWDWGFQIDLPYAATPTTDDGLPVMKFALRPSTTSSHAEGLKKWPVKVGEDKFFGLMVKFGSNWQEPSPAGWGAALLQGDYQACVNSTWGFFAHARDIRWVDLAGRQTWVGPPNEAAAGLTREYNNNDGAPQGPAPRAVTNLRPGYWYRIIAEIKDAYDSTGLARIWVKGPGYSTWTKTVDVENIPTLQWGTCDDGHSIAFNQQGYPVSQKFGFYSGPHSFSLDFEDTNFVIATSFDAAADVLR